MTTEQIQLVLEEIGMADRIMALSFPERISALLAIEDESIRAEVIVSLGSDEEKQSLLHVIDDECYRVKIIVSLRDDEDKKKLLEEIKNERYRAEIIASLSSDEDKKELLKKIGNKWNRVIIIDSLVDDEDREILLRDLDMVPRVRGGAQTSETEVPPLDTSERELLFQALGIPDVRGGAETIAKHLEDEASIEDLSTLPTEELERIEAELDAAIDKIRGKYGENSVQRASFVKAEARKEEKNH